MQQYNWRSSNKEKNEVEPPRPEKGIEIRMKVREELKEIM
jgi:hypothetical protein